MTVTRVARASVADEHAVAPGDGAPPPTTSAPVSARRLRRWMTGVGLVVVLVAALAAPARGAWLARTVADEPQYLLSALSLWEDADLDIADELRDERWRVFHEARLPEQTAPRSDGSRLSPHDPLLPLFLAVPVGLGGWFGAKLALAALAGALAALVVWTAVRRFSVRVGTAALVAVAFGVTPPLVSYGTQVYPEVLAAFLVTVAVASFTGRRSAPALVVGAVSLLVLPWASVKYLPAVVAIAGWTAFRLWRDGRSRELFGLVLAAAAAAAAYLGVHQAVYGGWTVYAAGDHFVGGELTVMGTSPDYLSRAQRLVGLLVDRTFGLVRWSPVWLLVVPALGALVKRRHPGWDLLAVVLAAGWLNATFVALTMHGWWWPGRQLVVVAPVAVLMVAVWADDAASVRAPARVPARRTWAVAVLGMVGLWSWIWLVGEVLADRRRLVVDFVATSEPLAAVFNFVLPDARRWSAADVAGWWIWCVALVGWATWSWYRTTRPEEDPR